MAQVPMLVIHKFKIGQRKFFFKQPGKLFLDRLCPMPHKHYEFINIPCHSATRYLSVVTLKFCGFMLGLSTEIFFSPHLAMQMRVIDKWQTFLGSIFHLPGSKLFLSHSK